MTERFLAIRELQRAFVRLCIPAHANGNSFHTRPLDLEPFAERDRRIYSRDLRIPSNNGYEMCAGLAGRIGFNLSNETIHPQPERGRGLLCSLKVGKPAKAQMGVLHHRFALSLLGSGFRSLAVSR